MTDISKATPRPWGMHQHAYLAISRGSRLIAQCGGASNNFDGGKTDQTNEANTALIIRAVNGYDEAIDALCAAHFYLTDSTKRDERSMEAMRANVIMLVSNALDQLRGETP